MQMKHCNNHKDLPGVLLLVLLEQGYRGVLVFVLFVSRALFEAAYSVFEM